VLLLASAGAVLAQVPVITSVIPMANARAAARSGSVTVNFSQPLTAASAGALKVFSAQRGGLRTRGTTPAVVSGNNLSFAPTAYDFRPGETVQYTVTTAAASAGRALAQARVGQFTSAVGGTGRGSFVGGSDVTANRVPSGVAMGDVDGDGALDLFIALRSSGAVGVCLNNGSGGFGLQNNVRVGYMPYGVVLGDVDGDGDLDLLVANIDGTVSVRLNDGSGNFSGSQTVSVGSGGSGSIATGDVDGDGDLDLLAANGQSNTASIRLNGGTGPLAAAPGHSAAALALFPNPAHSAATLTGAAPHAALAVLDVLGRVRLTATADAAGTARLALPEGLPAGVYAVRGGGAARRLVVE